MDTIETLLVSTIWHRYKHNPLDIEQIKAMREVSFWLSKRYLYLHPDWAIVWDNFEVMA